MLLELSNLTKTFQGTDGPVIVLDEVSLSLDHADALALTGESGSGKSTLLHIVAGLEPADSGRVVLGGRDITTLDDAARARLRREDIGIIFQQFNLIPSLNVRSNLTFQARLTGRQNEEFLAELVERLDLGSQLDKFPEQLSGGQQQRVAIGRALAAKPKILLADEPTGNLDEATGDAVFDLLMELRKAVGTSLLLVTHSERLAAQTDRRVHLHRGRISE